MAEILTMSLKESYRIKVVEEVKSSKLTVKEGSEILEISERQFYRIQRSYKSEGPKGLIHKSRGKPSNRGYTEELKEKVIRIYRKDFTDFGPTLFSEKLEEYYQIKINHETLRRWIRGSGSALWHRKKRPHRSKRERRSSVGSMMQFDGSHHDWFEGRGSKCCLLVCIDDASSRVHIRFSPTESTRSVFEILREYVEEKGIPGSIYVDRHSVYYEKEKQTDFSRAMKKLGVKIIYAKSPQAKGRVERSNKTFQDRLVKEMRLRGISTIGEANKFLREEFTFEYNKKFSNNEDLADIHRSSETYDLKNIFCYEQSRQVKNDYTISLSGQLLQLEISENPLPCTKEYVTIRKYLDDSVHIFYKEKELDYKLIKERPKNKTRLITKPKSDHPWRKIQFGKSRNA
jgi:transposase